MFLWAFLRLLLLFLLFRQRSILIVTSLLDKLFITPYLLLSSINNTIFSRLRHDYLGLLIRKSLSFMLQRKSLIKRLHLKLGTTTTLLKNSHWLLNLLHLLLTHLVIVVVVVLLLLLLRWWQCLKDRNWRTGVKVLFCHKVVFFLGKHRVVFFFSVLTAGLSLRFWRVCCQWSANIDVLVLTKSLIGLSHGLKAGILRQIIWKIEVSFHIYFLLVSFNFCGVSFS